MKKYYRYDTTGYYIILEHVENSRVSNEYVYCKVVYCSDSRLYTVGYNNPFQRYYLDEITEEEALLEIL